MTKDEYILYQAILLKKEHEWRLNLFSSLGKKYKFFKYLCDNHPFFEFPCFNADRLLYMACFELKIGTMDTPLHELRKLAHEYFTNIKDKTAPNSKAFCDAIDEYIKSKQEVL